MFLLLLNTAFVALPRLTFREEKYVLLRLINARMYDDKRLRWRLRWHVISFSSQSMHKEYFEKLLFEWSESRYSAIEWSLLSHEMQIQWWIVKMQKNITWFRKLVKISARTKKSYKYSWWSLSKDLLLVNCQYKKRSQSEISLTEIFKVFNTFLFLYQSRSLNFLSFDLAYLFLYQVH